MSVNWAKKILELKGYVVVILDIKGESSQGSYTEYIYKISSASVTHEFNSSLEFIEAAKALT